MDNIFSMTCNLQRRSIVLPVNYYTMIENRILSLYKGSSYCFCRQAVVKYEIEYPY